MTKPTTRAYVMKDGEVVSGSYLDQYMVAKDSGESQQVQPDAFSSSYTANNLVEPIYNPTLLAQLMDLSTYHARAVRTKAHDIAGLGWSIEAVDGVKKPDERERDRAVEVLTKIHPEVSLTELLDQFMVDYESTGNAYLEIMRGNDGTILGLEHVPAHTIRVHKDQTKFQQRRDLQHVWFARYGSDPINKHTGLPEDVDDSTRANELLHFKSYTPQSDYYGVPDIVPAIGAILGDQKRQEYNISFFDNHAIPAYAVTVAGADLDDETKESIKRFFQRDVKESPHSTLVLTADHSDEPDAPPVQFHFEKLATETKEASFSLYRGQNRDEILSAHGIPPYRAGVVTEGALGGNSASETTEIYKQSIVSPRKRRLEHRLTRVILNDGLGITDWQIMLGELDTRDLDREVERKEKLFKMGYYTPNELREDYGEEKSDQPGMDDHYINGRKVGEETNDDQFGYMMQSVKDLHTVLAANQAATK